MSLDITLRTIAPLKIGWLIFFGFGFARNIKATEKHRNAKIEPFKAVT